MDEIRKLNILRFHYNSAMISEMNSVYYDNDECEDDWVEIIPDSHTSGSYVVLIIRSGVTVKAFATDNDLNRLESLINTYIGDFYEQD